MKISIVIPTYNEEKYIGETLESLMKQTLKPDEIIIADYNSKDNTKSICESFNVKFVKVDKPGIGYGRQIGFEHAKGDIFVSASADVFYPINWLEELTKPLRKEDIVATIGSISLKDANKIEKIGSYLLNNIFIPMAFSLNLVFASADNLAIKSNIYKQIKGINPNLQTGEDTDLIIRAKKIGKIIYVKKANVFTSNRRIRKWNYLKYIYFHTKNFLSYNLFKKAAKEYEPIR